MSIAFRASESSGLLLQASCVAHEKIIRKGSPTVYEGLKSDVPLEISFQDKTIIILAIKRELVPPFPQHPTD
jgi:hypothetical protein